MPHLISIIIKLFVIDLVFKKIQAELLGSRLQGCNLLEGTKLIFLHVLDIILVYK
jgi:hypothetical protein